MDPILVIENDTHDPLGHLGDVLEERNVTAEVVRPGSGEAIPSLEGYSAVVVLGGEQGAYESELHPHLADEMQLIRDAVASDVPLLGICLGAQLVAHALGGRAYLAERPEVAVMQPTLTAEGAQDPLAPHLVKPTLVFHQDSFEVPPGAQTLAVSDRFPQVFRCGSALAIQPHPEVRIEDVEHWIAASDIPERAGVDAGALLEDMRSKVDRNDAAALFEAWLAEVAAT